MKYLSILMIGVLATINLAAPKPTVPMPPVPVREKGGEYGPEKWTWEGVAVVNDPINHETLYFGGRSGGAEFGTLGNWALADNGKTWRSLHNPDDYPKPIDPHYQSLPDKIRVAQQRARAGEAAARNIFYAALDPAAEADAIKAEPLRLINQSLRFAEEALEWVRAPPRSAYGAEKFGHTKSLLDTAVDNLQKASTGFADRRLDSILLKNCFDAQWALDEAAGWFADSPGPRVGAFAAYDPENKCVLLFGGSHGDYVMSDTWIYDCVSKGWRQCFPTIAPSARAANADPTLDEAKKHSSSNVRFDPDQKKIILSGGVTILGKMVYQKGFIPLPADRWAFDAATGEWSATGPEEKVKRVTAPGARIYRTIVPAYDPTWFDAAPRGDAAATAHWLANLTPNTWTKVPVPERPAAERDWGTARYDPDRDQIYRWTGGHQADPSNAMTTYHPGINRYSIGYVPEIYGKGMSFNGRPDCLNHTYLHCDYDPVSRCMVCTSMGGTGIYNPDREDWDYSIPQPFNHHVYLTCTVSTPIGVIVWTPGFFGVMDVKGKQWKPLPVVGKPPRSVTDGSALTYDRKRDCVWIFSHADYQKPSGQVWQYVLKTGAITAMDPSGRAPFAAPKGLKEIRECVYIPAADLVLLNNFFDEKEMAYDPAANRWVLLHIPRNQERLGTVSDTLVYDPKRELVWNLNSYKAVYVLKLDRASLQIENAPQR